MIMPSITAIWVLFRFRARFKASEPMASMVAGGIIAEPPMALRRVTSRALPLGLHAEVHSFNPPHLHPAFDLDNESGIRGLSRRTDRGFLGGLFHIRPFLHPIEESAETDRKLISNPRKNATRKIANFQRFFLNKVYF